MVIEKLKLKDIKEAAIVYNKGLQMEIPKGPKYKLKHLIKVISKPKIFVFKEKDKIKVFVSFKMKNKENVKMDFICVTKLRRGIGKKLMKKLAEYSLKNKIRYIYSNVSSKDKRVMGFYEKMGFEKYQKYYANKDFMLYRIKAKPEWILEFLKK
jgi:N-acetylglutamate synthase-like GNAT family acetyltransferase